LFSVFIFMQHNYTKREQQKKRAFSKLLMSVSMLLFFT